MCMTFEALAVFLNLLGSDIVTTEPGRVTIHAETADAVWQVAGDLWCTDAPELEANARFASVK